MSAKSKKRLRLLLFCGVGMTSCFLNAANETASPLDESFKVWVAQLKSQSLSVRQRTMQEMIQNYKPEMADKIKSAISIETNPKTVSMLRLIVKEGAWTPEMREMGRQLSWELRQEEPAAVEATFSTRPVVLANWLGDVAETGRVVYIICPEHGTEATYDYWMIEQDRKLIVFTIRRRLMKQYGGDWSAINSDLKIQYLRNVEVGKWKESEILADVASLLKDNEEHVRIHAEHAASVLGVR